MCKPLTLKKQVFEEGYDINRPSLFCGENYTFWKIRMWIFLELVDRGMYYPIINGSYIPMHTINNMQVEKDFVRVKV